jgi:hypothetical protein
MSYVSLLNKKALDMPCNDPQTQEFAFQCHEFRQCTGWRMVIKQPLNVQSEQ